MLRHFKLKKEIKIKIIKFNRGLNVPESVPEFILLLKVTTAQNALFVTIAFLIMDLNFKILHAIFVMI